MIIRIPVDVLCEGCEQCPNLEICSTILTAYGGEVMSKEFECKHIQQCLVIQEALERAQKMRENDGKADATETVEGGNSQ